MKQQALGCRFIRIDPDEEKFDVFKAIYEIFRHIKQSSNQLTKKALVDNISMRLCSDFTSYKNNGNLLHQL